jgi:hypothetical protein
MCVTTGVPERPALQTPVVRRRVRQLDVIDDTSADRGHRIEYARAELLAVRPVSRLVCG